jgi:hypothetical protein
MAAAPYPAYKTAPPRRPDKRYAPSGNESGMWLWWKGSVHQHYPRGTFAGWRLRLIRPTKPLRPVGRISGTRHPAMNLACGFGERVPFTSIIPEAPLPDGGCALSGLQNRSDPVGRISGTRHPAIYQRHRLYFYLQYDSDGVVSPLKSANRSGNDKVWTPWMADRGEPRQDVESSRPQSGTREVSAVRSTDFLAGPRGLTRGERPPLVPFTA